MKPLSREFCLERADDAARLASRAHLVKVRHHLLDAERAWRQMAVQALPTAVARAAVVPDGGKPAGEVFPLIGGSDDNVER